MKSMGPARVAAVAALCLVLAGCSSLNPINWFRDATGASKNDPPPDARNTANLEAGSERPYPNLGTVPPPPTRALATVERERLEKALVADRQNAKYTDDQLRAGQTASAPRPAAPRPAAARTAPQEGSAPASAPQEASAPAAAPPAAMAPMPPVTASPPPAPERPPTAAPSPPVAPARPLEPPATAQAAPETAPASEPAPPAPPPVASRYETGARRTAPVAAPEPAPSPPTPAPSPPTAAPSPPTEAPSPPTAASATADTPSTSASAPARSSRRTVEEPPQEAPLASPSVRSTPAPETPRPVPPPPAIGAPAPARTPAPAATRSAAVQEAALPPGAPVAQLTFADGSAALDAGARAKLADVAAQQKRAGGNVRVIAHAAPGRGATAQLDAFGMALDRANAVASALAQAGVPATSILVEAAPPAAGPAGRGAEIYLEP